MKIADDFLLHIRSKFSDVELYREQMHGYQSEGLDFLKKNPFSGLFIDMGLGKTVTCLTLIADLLSEFDSDDKILVIGPLRVATATWPDEIKKWNHLAHLNASVVHIGDDNEEVEAARKAAYKQRLASSSELFKSQKEKDARQWSTAVAAQKRDELRAAKTTSSASVHIISRDWVEWLVQFWNKRKHWPYSIIIIDESSGFKDHNSTRFKCLQAIRDQPGFVKRLHILTATPAAETYEHLFAQIYLLDRGARFGRDIGRFRDRYFIRPHQRDPSRKWKLRPDAENEILAKISDICLVMKEEDYLPKVPPLFVERKVRMTAEQYKLYLTMEKDMVVTLDDGSEVVAETAAALSAKLLQMGSGVLYETRLEPGQTEDDDHVKVQKIHRIHEHKIEELQQIVEESQGKPILVGFHHRASKDRLLKAFPQATLMDAEGKCIKKWNQGKIPMLLMHPASGGHGLNLQAGGHIIVFFDIPWSLELYLQFIGRLARQGQKHRVTVFHIVCEGTLDHTVLEALTAKEDAQDKLFKILKRMRKKLRKLLKGRESNVKPGDADWDKVVEVLTNVADIDDDRPPPTAQELIDDFGLDPRDAEITAYEERLHWEDRQEHCPNCGDPGGPCGPGSDCYDDL